MHAAEDARPSELLGLLREAVVADPADALLLSGGVDSALLAALDSATPVITVRLRGASSRVKPTPGVGCHYCRAAARYPRWCGSDLVHARCLARRLGIVQHIEVRPTVAETLATLDELVLGLRSYDLVMLNDITTLLGLRAAAARGWQRVRTGEDADSLFRGYSYLYAAAELPHTSPPSERVFGLVDGVQPVYPYRHPAVVAFARRHAAPWHNVAALPSRSVGAFVDQFDPALADATLRPFGKVLLRRAAGALLPRATAWRPKVDMEFGAGMCRLEAALAGLCVTATDAEWAEIRRRRFFPNPAHVGLFLRFHRLGLTPSSPEAGQSACRWCGAGLDSGDAHCATCGAPDGRRPDGGVVVTGPDALGQPGAM